MTTSIYRRVLAVALLAALVVPFQNCGEKADLGTYVNNSSTGAAVPTVPLIPEIMDSSADTTVAFFESTALGVVAAGEGPLTYEWKKDGVVIPGQFKSILTVADPVGASPSTPSTIYNYTVTVKDKDGESVSKDIRLTVTRSAAQSVPPTITAAGLVDATPITACVNGTNHTARVLSVTTTGTKVRTSWNVSYVDGGQNFTDPLFINANGEPVTNYTRYFVNGTYIAKCIIKGTYKVTATDYFGQTTTRDVVINY